MKIYVLPVEEICDGKCFFCITKRRKVAEEDLIDLRILSNTLEVTKDIDKIEITGGGEPTLHPQIDEVIKICSSFRPASMYTHGEHLGQLKRINELSELCISLAHYEEEKNKAIMGVYPDFDALREIKIPIKFSLIATTRGIYEESEIIKYLDFVKEKGGSKVVIRQLFEETKGLEKFFVSTEKLFNNFKSYPVSYTKQGNPLVDYHGMSVEFEYRSCACEMDNLVLHTDGKLITGWQYK